MVKKEGEPVSPIPALVPVCEQTAYIKSGPSSDRGKLEDLSSTKSNNSQLSVKSESDKENARQSGQLSAPGLQRKTLAKAPSGDTTLQLGSDSGLNKRMTP